MKKVMSLMLIIAMLMIFSTNVLAADPNAVFGDLNNKNASTITGGDYANAQKNNTTNTNATKNNAVNNNTNNTTLPQTGIEDYNVGILLIISVASAVFAYRKVSNYRNI